MADRIGNYFSVRGAFGLSGSIDLICFVLAILVLFYDGKGRTVKNTLIFVAHMAGLYAALLLAGLLFSMMTEEQIIISYLPKLIVLAVYVIFFNHYKWQARVMLAVLIYALHFMFVEIGASLQGICNAKGPWALPESFRTYTIPLVVLAAALLRYFNVNKFRIIPLRAVALCMGFSAVGIALSILRSVVMPYLMVFERTEYYLYGLYPQIFIFVTLIFILLFMFACYFFVARDLKSHEDNMELSKKAMRKEISDTLVAINENNLDQLRKIRHEIKNRYAVMQVMIQNKQYDQLEAYFNEINKESAVIYTHVDTGNEAFDMIFNLELSKAASQKTEVSTKLIVPSKLPLSEIDLGGLITNLMDNAIEACEKIKEGARRIEVSAQVVHSYFVMRISNTVAEDRRGEAITLKTDKPNKELHGYGSKIVDDIVKKHNGQILRRIQDGMFTVDVMLDMEYKKSE